VTRRLFIGNFDFEHRLAYPAWNAPAALKQRNAELAAAWLAIAEEGDLIWTAAAFDHEFLPTLQSIGLPNVVVITSLAQAPRDVECIPWGWSDELRRLVDRFGWLANAPSDQAIRTSNSRSTSFDLEQQFGTALPNTRRIQSVDELKAITRDQSETDRWVIKAPYGMSARERILGQGFPRVQDENWVRRQLSRSACVFFEPWVERINEIGIQIDVPQSGSVQLIGITPMVVDQRGQYAGSWFAYCQSRFELENEENDLWAQATEIALRAASHLQSVGYFGPLGIDAMIYRDLDRTLKVRPLQDINARWTMGRLSLGWRRFVGPNDEGFWQHGDQVDAAETLALNATNVIVTSPKTVGNLPCRHFSRLVIERHSTPPTFQT
jgi:hypothetical protein